MGRSYSYFVNEMRGWRYGLFTRFGARALLVALLAAAMFAALCASAAVADEFRAFWVDAFHDGFLNQTQVDKLLGVAGNASSLGDIRNANCNAVFVQVRRRADTCYPSSMGEPYFSGLTPADYNALKAIIASAHDTTGGKKRIEVHCWLVTFATDPATSDDIYYQHNDPGDPDNYWVTLDSSGNETSDKAFDPGHPLCEEYLTNVCMDLVNNFDIDGIHLDYIRFTGSTQGYNPISVARYNGRYGTTGNPSSTDSRFQQWRRDQITSFVRKVYARIQAAKPQVLLSGSFVCGDPAPTASTHDAFKTSQAYKDYYSDWDSWLQEGIVDMAVPMTYFDLIGSYSADYAEWMNFQKDRKANRHMVVGPGIYLNYFADAISELQMTRDASASGNYADGFSGYSYACPYATTKGSTYGSWSSFSPTFVSQVCPTWANIPNRPWKSNPTKGHISGAVSYTDTGAWADGATVSISGPEQRTQTCDGTGFYAFIDLTPGDYTVTASQAGYPESTRNVTVQVGSVTGNIYLTDLALGVTTPPVISSVQAHNVNCAQVNITWDTDQGATSLVDYGLTATYGSTTPIDNAPVRAHSVTLSELTPNTTYHFRVTSTSANGSVTSDDYTFTTLDRGLPPVILPSSVQATSITSNTAKINWTTDIPATSQVHYGLTTDYAQHTNVDEHYVTAHSVSISGLTPSTLYHFRVESTSMGLLTTGSADYSFTTATPPADTIIDDADTGATYTGTWSNGTYSGGYNNTYKYAGTEITNTASCTWTPNLFRSGTYDVYCYYLAGSNRTTAARYTVYYSGGSHVAKTLSQQVNGGKWNLLASGLQCDAGTEAYVKMTNKTGETDKVIVADAIKFVYTGSDVNPPTIPQNLVATAASSSSILLTWDASTDDKAVTGYNVYRGTTLVTTSKTTTYTDAGRSANKQFTYTVSAVDAAGNESGLSNAVSRYTLSKAPTAAIITCDKTAATWYNTAAFVFQNQGFGSGKVTKYRTVWDSSPTHTWTDTESSWTTTTLTSTATSTSQAWYFHVRGYNAEGIPNGSLDLGPYRYENAFPTAEVTVNDDAIAQDGDFLKGTLSVDVSAADTGGSGLSKAEIKLDAGEYQELTGSEGRYSYECDITESWTNGPHSVTVKITDGAGNFVEITKGFTVNKNEIRGLVAVQSFVVSPVNRDVTLVLDGTVSKTVTLKFINGVAPYSFTDVDEITSISAKTNWTLRKKISGISWVDGQCTASFTGSNILLGGDLDGDNLTNTIDYTILRNAWGVGSRGDINGDGLCDNADYLILKLNWYKKGDPQ